VIGIGTLDVPPPEEFRKWKRRKMFYEEQPTLIWINQGIIKGCWIAFLVRAGWNCSIVGG